MKYSNILKAVAGVALLFGAAACTDEVKFDPTAPVAGEGCYFAADGSTTVDIEENATEAPVAVYRTNTEGAYTATIDSSVKDEEGNTVTGVLTVPSTVSFAAGESESFINVGVDFSKVEVEKVYYVTLSLTDQTSPYGVSSKTFEFSYAPWTEWTAIANASDPGYYQQNTLWDNLYPTFVYERKSLTNPNRSQYAVDSPFSNLEYQVMWEMDKSYKVEVDGVECYRCFGLNYVNTTVNSSNGVPYLFAEYSWWMMNVVGGWTIPELVDRYDQQGNPRSYFNPVQGRFYLQMIVWDEKVPVGNAYFLDYETLQLPGNYKEYFLNFNYSGNFVDTEGNEYGIVNATRSEDVNSFAYNILPGALTEDEVDAEYESMSQDTELEMIYDYSYNIQFSPDEEGDYTIVGLGYDESGAVVCKNYYTFNYKSVQKESDWDSVGWCEYTDGIVWGMFEFQSGGYLGGETVEVEVERNKKDPSMYRLVNPYKEMGENYGIGLSGNYYLPFQIFSNGAVILWQSQLGICDPTEQSAIVPLSVYSYAEYFIDGGYSLEDVIDTPWAGTFKNNEVTFNSCTLFIMFDGDDGLYYANKTQQVVNAMKNGTFNAKLLPTGYGVGPFKIDLSYTGLDLAPKKAHTVKAPKAAKGTLKKVAVKSTDMKANMNKIKGVKSSKAIREVKKAKATPKAVIK